MMRCYLNLILALFFLHVQVASLWHVAEHGFAEHKHNGHVCDIYLHCEQVKYISSAAGFALSVPEYVALAVTQPEIFFVLPRIYPAASPRAPPHFS